MNELQFLGIIMNSNTIETHTITTTTNNSTRIKGKQYLKQFLGLNPETKKEQGTYFQSQGLKIVQNLPPIQSQKSFVFYSNQ